MWLKVGGRDVYLFMSVELMVSSLTSGKPDFS